MAKKYCTISEISALFPISKTSLYRLIRNNAKFRDSCTYKLGKKTIIKLDEFEEFVRQRKF